MKKINRATRPSFRSLFFLTMTTVFFMAGCKKYNEPTAQQEALQSEELQARGGHNNDIKLKEFKQVNLVASSDAYSPLRKDAALINGWGIAFSATGTPWVSSQGGHVSTVYNSEGATVLGPVHISSPAGPEGGNPTGIIFNPVATDFVIPSGNTTAPAAARFIFVGLDGVVSGWNGSWGTHSYAKFNHSATAAYTGLAIAANGGANFLYAADFRRGKIVVWDREWNPVSMSFRDPYLPWGYSPFNIQVIGDMLYVTYAKVGADGKNQAGVGKGFVSIFKTNGRFVKRFASHDRLNSPWGVAMAPASFFPEKMYGDDDDDNHGHGGDHYRHGHDDNTPEPAILVGNFGDGRINVYSLKGKFLGQLKKSRKAIEIDGLWAISFPPSTSTIDPNRLYFAAGPEHETAGIFGYLIKD